jgi:hypothetical protein
VYLGSSGCTAIAVSPNIVSGLVVATMIFSSDPSISYANDVIAPNSNFSLGS